MPVRAWKVGDRVVVRGGRYVHAYECNICSIWVYFAAMVRPS